MSPEPAAMQSSPPMRMVHPVVVAGMEYAVHVHFRDGYKVLVSPDEAQIKPLLQKLKL